MTIKVKTSTEAPGFRIDYSDLYGYQIAINVQGDCPTHVIAYHIGDLKTWHRKSYGIDPKTYMKRDWIGRMSCTEREIVSMREYFRDIHKIEYKKVRKMKCSKGRIETFLR